MKITREKNREYAERYRKKNPVGWLKMKREATRRYREQNREICRARVRKWARENPKTLQRIRFKANLKRYYGITPEDFSLMLETQNRRCAICLHRKKLSVDHCHKSKKVRGLLCRDCNFSLGLLRDSVDNLSRAVKYLNKHKPNRTK